MTSSEKLDTSPYIVSLDDKDARSYLHMREKEDAWLTQCEQAGCTLVRSKGRQCVVLAPLNILLPELDLAPYQAWRDTVSALAEAQGKKASVGSRSSTPPTWLTLEGQRWPLSETRPDYLICSLRYRYTRAARGAKMTADDALDYTQALIVRAEKALESSQRHGQKKRIPAQEQRLERLLGDQSALHQLITHARQRTRLIGVQVLSGDAWKITAKTTDKRSITTSISTIAVMPSSTVLPTVEPAPTRHSTSRAIEQVAFPNISLQVSLYNR